MNFTPSTEAGPDWSFVETGIYDKAIKSAAAKISRDRGGVVEYDDMVQEAMIYIATRPEEISRYVVDGEVQIGKLSNRLYSRLLDMTDTAAGRAQRQTSYEASLRAA
ncbi:hypothetical protein [Actinocorallia libanotica]|uniref:Uncharacterized protein n=1 Tax=Actinocorallia libanotica TaxID=46162 RepID=A0ABP4CES4_9ACTN